MSKQPLRIACLHGYCQNAQSFRRKTGALRKSLTRSKEKVRADVNSGSITLSHDDAPLAELFYLDAPFVVEEHLTAPSTPLSLKFPSSETKYAVLRPRPIQYQTVSENFDQAQRTWWIADRDQSAYIGTNHAMSYLQDVFRENHFDGLLGFSQGAVMASIICAMRENPAFESLRFALLFSGFRSRATVHQPLYQNPIKVPSFHAWGEQDDIVPQNLSEKLKDTFEGQIRSHHIHKKGHLVPGDADTRRAASRFLLLIADDDDTVKPKHGG